MGFAISIVLVTFGAILAFVIDVPFDVDYRLVGWIMLGAGVAVFAGSLALSSRVGGAFSIGDDAGERDQA